MRLLSGLATPFLLSFALLAALGAILVVTPGRNLTDADDFAAATARAAASSEGQAAIADELTGVVASETGVPPDVVGAAIDPAVAAAARDPAFTQAVEAAARAAHASVVSEDPSGNVSIPLGAIRDPVADELEGIDPRLASLLPPAADLGEVELAGGPAVRVLGRSAYALGRPGVLAALVLVSLSTGAIGLLLARRRARAATALGIGLIVVAGVPFVLSWIAPPVAESLGEVSGRAALAGALASELFAVQATASAVAACAGAALVVVGIASRFG